MPSASGGCVRGRVAEMYKLSVLRAGEYFAFLFYVMVNTSEKSSVGVLLKAYKITSVNNAASKVWSFKADCMLS